jgi:heptosyltransferase III
MALSERPLLKRLEHWLKNAAARILIAVFWRPQRRRTLGHLRRALLVRTDNRVGEALLLTPVISALAAKGLQVDALVHPKMLRVLSGLPDLNGLHPLSVRSVWRLRKMPFDAIINCGNWLEASVSNAIVSRLVSPRGPVLGPAVEPVKAWSDIQVEHRLDTRHEVLQRLHLAAPIVGEQNRYALSFRASSPIAVKPASLGPFAVVNPGGRLGVRRVSPALFCAAVRGLQNASLQALITFGPGEESLAQEIVARCPTATLAPPTTLDGLAGLMRSATCAVTNNTGPMHLAVAVGCPTLGLFLNMDVNRWGHHFVPHRMLDVTGVKDAELLVERSTSEWAVALAPGVEMGLRF